MLDLLQQLLSLVLVLRKVLVVALLHFLELQTDALDLLLVVAAQSLPLLFAREDEKFLLLESGLKLFYPSL